MFSLLLLVATVACSESSTLAAQPGAAPETGKFVSDSTELAYAFDRPAGNGPFPVIVLVHGSGPVTRDEMLGIVPKFTALGFAVFRYDKRGVGQSGGTYRGVGPLNSVTQIPELARDAAAAYRTACGARGIDATKCGFFGASQAGWIIPEAMRLSSNPAFGIMFSGVTIPVGTQIYFTNFSERDHLPLDSAYAGLPRFSGPTGYDPTKTLSEMRTPTLWLQGMKDPLLPNRLQVAQLDSLRRQGLPITVKSYPEYTHSLGPDVWPDITAFLSRFH